MGPERALEWVAVVTAVLTVACGGSSRSTGALDDTSGTSGTAGVTSTGATGGGGVGVGGVGGTGGSGARGGNGADGGIAGDFAGSCGDGRHDDGEECDDANVQGGDGCSRGCLVERDWSCPQVGPCVSTHICGDGGLAISTESCDDGNSLDGDGCSSTCQLEPGWLCPAPGRRCRPICGDLVIHAPEQCDDGNALSGDGCSSACVVEYPRCTTSVSVGGAAGEGGASSIPVCKDPVCGDGLVTAPEECDDGGTNNDGSYGRCTTDCRFAPFCGDGIVAAAGLEECDEGWAPSTTSLTPGCRACHFTPYCGDGSIDPLLGEECDAGIRNGLSSCTIDCKLVVR